MSERLRNNTSNQPVNSNPRNVIDGTKEYDPVEAGNELVKSMDERQAFSTSQLRKILSATAVVKNKLDREGSTVISKEMQAEIQYLRLKLVYQMGRDRNVKIWLKEKTIDLESIVHNIKDSKEAFDRMYRLIESIVAYNKFYFPNK